MAAREKLIALKEKFGPAIQRADIPDDGRLFVFVEAASLTAVCRHLFRVLDARYVTTIGADALTLKFTPKTGRFTGTFKLPAGGRPVSVNGVMLQTPVTGEGFFLNDGQSGAVRIEPTAP